LSGDLVVGWTGTFSTLKYLQILVPAIQQLQQEFDFTFLVIADKDPLLPIKKYRFVKWNKSTEVEDLLLLHIGVMPLRDSEIEKGKCGFKAIQYMALGIPPVISPVGMNTILVTDEQDGFLAEDEKDWVVKLRKLLTDKNLRVKVGENARRKIVEQYSVNATSKKFIELFT
jgi:glycosyltransferase involved in cell wall biosynthesis